MKLRLKQKEQQTGFTLIELLVVVSIIGLLASVLLVAVNKTRIKARDAKRVADIAQIQKALELYYDDNGQYPPSGGADYPNGVWSNSTDDSWNTLQGYLQKYLSKLPHDPSEVGPFNSPVEHWGNTGGAYSYESSYAEGNCKSNMYYDIVYRLETANGPDPGIFCANAPDSPTGWFQYGGTSTPTFVKTIGVGHN